MIELYFNKILEALSLSFAVSSFNVSKLRIAADEGFLRVKCTLSNDDVLEFAEYVKIIHAKSEITSYSYHWQRADGMLVKRWDNVPHHPELDGFPNHWHKADGKVEPSPPMSFQQVLFEIQTILRTRDAK